MSQNLSIQSRKNILPAIVIVTGIIGAAAMLWRLDAARATAAHTGAINEPSVVAATPEEAGRYIVRIGGCNDCHTPEFMQRGEAVPESQWLIGVAMGFKGPWGTSYARNLRAKVQSVPEDSFVAGVKSTTGRPPMPWAAVHAMSDADLRNVYRYIKSLGPSDNSVPAALPPGETPKTPYMVFEPVFPK